MIIINNNEQVLKVWINDNNNKDKQILKVELIAMTIIINDINNNNNNSNDNND